MKALAELYPEEPLRASIREAECIGCTKCLPVCPVDAILGASKQMHTVMIDVCIGCQLCVAACPVDCIDMLPCRAQPDNFVSEQRYATHNERLARSTEEQLKPLQTTSEETKAYLQRVRKRKG